MLVLGVNMIVQFTHLGHYPFWSCTMILIDTLAIYGLVVYGPPEVERA